MRAISRNPHWGSVRKIRTIVELLDLFSVFGNRNEIDHDTLRESLTSARTKQMGFYLGTRRRGVPNIRWQSDDPNAMTRLISDRTSFARALGIWTMFNSTIRLSSLGRSLKERISSSRDPRSILLGLLMRSKYAAY